MTSPKKFSRKVFSVASYFTSPDTSPVSLELIKIKIGYLKKHHNRVENLFEAEMKELALEAEEEESHFGTNRFDEEYSSINWLLVQEIQFVNIRMHRYSTILAIYSYLESSLQKICFEVEKNKLCPISVKDLNKDGIERSVLYIEKVTSINPKLPNDTWENIQHLKSVRNCIMHGSGDINLVRDSYKKKIENLAVGDKVLTLIDQCLIMVKSEFIIDVLTCIEAYLVELNKNVQELSIS
jgi:hypothetical protein